MSRIFRAASIQILSAGLMFGLLTFVFPSAEVLSQPSKAEYIHKAREFDAPLLKLPTDVSEYRLVKSFTDKKREWERLYTTNRWFVPDYWFDREAQNYDCEVEYWVVRWKSEYDAVDIATNYAIIWSFKNRNRWAGFDERKDSIVLYTKSKVGRSGYISGSRCEVPVFRSINYGNAMIDIDLDIQIWRKR
jgi:hypothetical protein